MPAQDSWYQLPQDMNQWQTAIIENISRKIPEIPQYIAGIDFNKVEPIIGDADGLMYLMGGLAAIPITVRQNRLAPLDLMVTKNEEFYPVSEVFLQKVYADNVLGQPSDVPGRQDDLQEDGPARQIKYYNTVDKVKQASYKHKVELRDAIEKSAKVLAFFDKHRPEVLQELYTAEPEPIKVAKDVEPDLPNLHFLAHEGDTYTFNAEPITVKQAADLMGAFKLTDDEKSSVLRGGHICLDYREKHSTVVTKTASSGPMVGGCCSEDSTSSNLFLATVLTLDGVPTKGFLYRNYSCSGYKFLFISPTFYAMQDDIHILEQTMLKEDAFFNSMKSADPQVGMFGVVATKYTVRYPMQVAAVNRYGNVRIIKGLSHDIDAQEYTLDEREKFFPIPDERKSLVRNADEAMYTMPGRNYSVALDGEGRLVIDGESHSYVNAVYHLMDKLAMEYDDALHIVERAASEGKVTFKVAEDKSEDKDDDKSKDKKDEDKSEDKKDEDKKDDSDKDDKDTDGPPRGDGKGTKDKDTDGPPKEKRDSDSDDKGTEDKSEKKNDGPPQKEDESNGPPQSEGKKPLDSEDDTEEEQQGSYGSQQPSAQEMSPEQQAAAEQEMEQQQLAATQQQATAVQQMPVQAEDLEDIAKINDPTLMDAYLSGKLTDVNTAGREQMMQASDAIVNGIKAVGKVLFLIRLGKVDYIKEEDAQMALNKLSDVARSIGVASSQLM